MLHLCFLAKSQELKKDIEILSQTFERVIDRKEAIIKSLVKDINEAEEQYQMALRSHLQNVDGLIGMTYCMSLVVFMILFTSNDCSIQGSLNRGKCMNRHTCSRKLQVCPDAVLVMCNSINI